MNNAKRKSIIVLNSCTQFLLDLRKYKEDCWVLKSKLTFYTILLLYVASFIPLTDKSPSLVSADENQQDKNTLKGIFGFDNTIKLFVIHIFC